MAYPKVSIIIPAFNAEKYIAETLASVRAISYLNWECILVNDGSTDNTLALVDHLTEGDPRFKVISQSNSGPSVARNKAIYSSDGCYILPLDADDLISETYVEKAVAILENCAGLKLVYCNALKFGQQNCPWHLPDYSFHALLIENMIFCSALFRRADFLKTRGYDPKLVKGREDWDFWLELLKTGGDVYKIPEVHFYYRTHKRSRDKQANIDIAQIRRQIYENHRELYQGFFDNPIQLLQEHAFFKKKYNLLRRLTFRKPIC